MTNMPTLIANAPERAQHLIDLTLDTAQTTADRVERSAGAVVDGVRTRLRSGRERLVEDVERAKAALDARVAPLAPATRGDVAALEARLAEIETRTKATTTKAARPKATTKKAASTKAATKKAASSTSGTTKG